MEIENTLAAGQAFVGGLIDVYPVTDKLDLVCNDEGIIDGLEVRGVILGEGKIINKRDILAVIHGDCYVCRHNEEGDFVSIEYEDVETIKHYVRAVMSISNGIIMVE